MNGATLLVAFAPPFLVVGAMWLWAIADRDRPRRVARAERARHRPTP